MGYAQTVEKASDDPAKISDQRLRLFDAVSVLQLSAEKTRPVQGDSDLVTGVTMNRVDRPRDALNNGWMAIVSNVSANTPFCPCFLPNARAAVGSGGIGWAAADNGRRRGGEGDDEGPGSRVPGVVAGAGGGRTTRWSMDQRLGDASQLFRIPAPERLAVHGRTLVEVQNTSPPFGVWGASSDTRALPTDFTEISTTQRSPGGRFGALDMLQRIRSRLSAMVVQQVSLRYS